MEILGTARMNPKFPMRLSFGLRVTHEIDKMSRNGLRKWTDLLHGSKLGRRNTNGSHHGNIYSPRGLESTERLTYANEQKRNMQEITGADGTTDENRKADIGTGAMGMRGGVRFDQGVVRAKSVGSKPAQKAYIYRACA